MIMNRTVVLNGKIRCSDSYGDYTESYQVVYSDDSELTYDVLGKTGIFIKGGFETIDQCREFAKAWFGGV